MRQAKDRKLRAIELHTEQANQFQVRYRALERDPYSSTFTYGRYRIEAVIDRELSTFSPGIRALDVGCGTGFNVARLRERGFDVVGVEPAEGMRRWAQANNPDVEIIDGDIEYLPFPASSFDLVLAIEVIRYLPDPTRALAEIARVLRGSGTAIVTVAPRWSLNGYSLINVVTGRFRVPSFTKVRHSFMSVRSAERAVRGAGFSHVRIHGAFLGPWHLLGRLSKRTLSATLRAFEPADVRLADLGPLRDLSNHLVIVSKR